MAVTGLFHGGLIPLVDHSLAAWLLDSPPIPYSPSYTNNFYINPNAQKAEI
jgi:hypothetical protein